MMGPGKFRQIDVTRALRAAKAAGLTISRVEIDRDGKIVVIAGSPEGAAPARLSALEQWKADQQAAEQRPSAYEQWKATRGAKK